MAIVKVENKSYTVEPLYQWDQNQVLEIRGLSMAKVPEVHFTNVAMSRAIVRQAGMDLAGVITVIVPNTLLQQAGTMTVYLCTYEGGTFQTLYKLEVQVKARKQPTDYVFEDEAGEVYSFNALENMVYNAERELRAQYAEFTTAIEATAQEAKGAAAASANSATVSANSASASARSAEEAKNAAAEAAAEAVSAAILKSDIVEIVKVSELPTNPASDVLYVIVGGG